jgi:hypothetical protein
MGQHGMDSSGSEKGQSASSYEHISTLNMLKNTVVTKPKGKPVIGPQL